MLVTANRVASGNRSRADQRVQHAERLGRRRLAEFVAAMAAHLGQASYLHVKASCVARCRPCNTSPTSTHRTPSAPPCRGPSANATTRTTATARTEKLVEPAKNNFVIEPWTQLLFDDFTTVDSKDVKSKDRRRTQPERRAGALHNQTQTQTKPRQQRHTPDPSRVFERMPRGKLGDAHTRTWHVLVVADRCCFLQNGRGGCT